MRHNSSAARIRGGKTVRWPLISCCLPWLPHKVSWGLIALSRTNRRRTRGARVRIIRRSDGGPEILITTDKGQSFPLATPRSYGCHRLQ